jgi:excisionase family DNA binding protein
MAYSILEQLEAEPKLMDVKRLAAILDVSPKTVYKMVEEGRLPALSVGSLLKFDPQVVSFWIRRQNPVFAMAARDAARTRRRLTEGSET